MKDVRLQLYMQRRRGGPAVDTTELYMPPPPKISFTKPGELPLRIVLKTGEKYEIGSVPFEPEIQRVHDSYNLVIKGGGAHEIVRSQNELTYIISDGHPENILAGTIIVIVALEVDLPESMGLASSLLTYVTMRIPETKVYIGEGVDTFTVKVGGGDGMLASISN